MTCKGGKYVYNETLVTKIRKKMLRLVDMVNAEAATGAVLWKSCS